MVVSREVAQETNWNVAFFPSLLFWLASSLNCLIPPSFSSISFDCFAPNREATIVLFPLSQSQPFPRHPSISQPLPSTALDWERLGETGRGWEESTAWRAFEFLCVARQSAPVCPQPQLTSLPSNVSFIRCFVLFCWPPQSNRVTIEPVDIICAHCRRCFHLVSGPGSPATSQWQTDSTTWQLGSISSGVHVEAEPFPPTFSTLAGRTKL